MEDRVRRSFLCSRCGAVTEPAVLGSDGKGEGACPDCGLGFRSSALFSRPARGPLAAWWARRQGRRHIEAHRRQREDILRRRPFAVFGLDDRWTGARWAGGWGGSDKAVDRIGLGFGDPFDDRAPLVRVFTWRLSAPTDRLTVANVAHELAEYLWQEGGADHDLVRTAFTSEDPTATWTDLSLPVDGRSLTFRSLAAGSFWVALGRVGECLISVEARHIDAARVALVTVKGVEPYLGDAPSPH